MQHISGISREQLSFSTLEASIGKENPVRFIDAFSHQLNLSKIGFNINTLKSEGRPSYESSIFIRVYLYGYLNGIRSCRKLERECIRNIELQSLFHGIIPNYKSISDFRKDNSVALKNVFKLFVSFFKKCRFSSRRNDCY